MTRLKVLNDLFSITTNEEKILNDIKKMLTFPDTSKAYIRGRFNKKLVENRTLYVSKDSYLYISIGFLSSVIAYLNNNEIGYNIDDKRDKLILPDDHKKIKNILGDDQRLDNNQLKALTICVNESNCIIKMPTSAGKTRLFLAMIKLFNVPTLILFNSVTLAKQTYDRAKKSGLDIGMVQGSNVDENHMFVIVSVRSKDKLKRKYDMVIVDECHYSCSKNYIEILQNKNIKYRFGFSATPVKEKKFDNAKIEQYLGKVVYDVEANNMIERGRLAKPIIRFVKINSDKLPDDIKYGAVYRDGIVNNEIRNQAIVQIAKGKKHCIVMVVRDQHGRLLKNMIPGSIFMNHKTPADERQEMIERFKNDPDLIIIVSGIFDDGISIDEIETLIIASGGKAQTRTIQRAGRALRVHEKKNTVNIYDFFDKQHGILTKHSRTRWSHYKNEGYEDIEMIEVDNG